MRTAKYFTATWCGPCKAFKPVMNEVAGEGYFKLGWGIFTHRLWHLFKHGKWMD